MSQKRSIPELSIVAACRCETPEAAEQIPNGRILRFSLACALWLFFVQGCAVGPDSVANRSEKGRALALLSIEPAADYDSYEDPNDWWYDLKTSLNMDFWRLCWSDDYEQSLTALVRQFGEHGPMADMKLCMADSLLMAEDYEHPPRFLSVETLTRRPEFRVVAERYKEIQRIVAKTQVEMFLENPDLLERYYNLNIWSGQFVSGSYNEWQSLFQKAFGLDEFLDDDETDPDYWWYARQFMLGAHATGRDDLLGNVRPTELSSRFEIWNTWLWTNVWEDEGWTRLFPHPEKPIWVERDGLLAEGRELANRPALPFPDWNATAYPLHANWSLLRDWESLSLFFGDRLSLSGYYNTCEESVGAVANVSELPYIGPAVPEFPADGEIKYASRTYCHPDYTHYPDLVEVLFAGSADQDDIMNYCRENGWSLTSSGAYADHWADIIARHCDSIDPNEFRIAAASKDYEFLKDGAIPTGDCCGDPTELRINCNSRDGSFTGHAWAKIHKQSACPEDDPAESAEDTVIDQNSKQDSAPTTGQTRMNSIGMVLVWIPPGNFKMGSTLRGSGERPIHDVNITEGFWMGQTEVTLGQYKTIMGSEPWSEESEWVQVSAHNPAVYIDWHDAVEFCKKLGQKEGVEYRLPTEAEWEYACRAGSETPYHFGKDADQIGLYAWYQGNSRWGKENYVRPVGTKKPNPWGLYDMYGNANEWCSDWYDEKYYFMSPAADPKGPKTGTSRVLRGGSWATRSRNARSSTRNDDEPDERYRGYGFRVVATGFK